MPTVPLEELLARRGPLFTSLRSGSHYVRRPAVLVNPEATTDHIRRRFQSSVVSSTPDEGVAVFHNVVLSGAGLIHLGHELLAETLEKPTDPVPEPPGPARSHYETGVAVGKRGNRNYGHFLVEQLPRLVMCRDAYPVDAPILLHQQARAFAPAMLDYVGIAPERVRWLDNSPVSVAELYWPTRNTFHPLNCSPHVFAFLRGLAAGNASHRRRLYVGRTDATTRTLLNDSQVFSELQSEGFERVLPGQMSFADQIESFAAAEVLVGVTGAALTNMVFMPPGSTVVMMGPATAAGFFFWDLAHHCGHRLVALWGKNEDPTVLDKNASFWIDLGLLRRALEVL